MNKWNDRPLVDLRDQLQKSMTSLTDQVIGAFADLALLTTEDTAALNSETTGFVR